MGQPAQGPVTPAGCDTSAFFAAAQTSLVVNTGYSICIARAERLITLLQRVWPHP
jgi:hypothetical protein